MMRRWLCAVLGGHAWSTPQIVDGRLRLRCLLDCGAVTVGIETRGQEREREAKERRVTTIRKWQAREKRREVA